MSGAGRDGNANEGTCLAVIVCQLLCANDSVQVCLHELLDNWGAAGEAAGAAGSEATYSISP